MGPKGFLSQLFDIFAGELLFECLHPSMQLTFCILKSVLEPFPFTLQKQRSIQTLVTEQVHSLTQEHVRRFLVTCSAFFNMGCIV